MTLLAFRHRSGAAEFTCTGCGRLVMVIVPPDDQPVCLTCRFIESEVPEEGRAAVREYLAAKEAASP